MGTKRLKEKIFRILIKEKPQIFGNNRGNFGNNSYSQEGEDLILKRFFEGRKNGFFIDVGAHHPIRFSNTFLFYQLGWRGINIDASPNSMKEFDRIRGEDINLEIPISEKKEKLVFNIFNESALNTFDKTYSDQFLLNPEYKIIERRELQTTTLANILESYLKIGTNINFMSVDVEGMDLKVLKSNNWEKFKPEVVVVEMWGVNTIDQLQNHLITKFLLSKGYSFFAKTLNSCFFKFDYSQS